MNTRRVNGVPIDVHEYLAWLKREVARIQAGGVWPPWMSKTQTLDLYRQEIDWVQTGLN